MMESLSRVCDLVRGDEALATCAAWVDAGLGVQPRREEELCRNSQCFPATAGHPVLLPDSSVLAAPR